MRARFRESRCAFPRCGSPGGVPTVMPAATVNFAYWDADVVSRVMDHRSNVDRGGSRMLPHPNLSNTHRVRIHTSNNQNGGFQLLYVTNTERFISHYCVHGSMTAGVYRQAVIFG